MSMSSTPPPYYKSAASPALNYKVVAESGPARVGELFLPHGRIDTPVFMPVGTQGTIKGLTSQQVRDLSPQIILGNTYHLASHPGADEVDKFGGLHGYMDWDRNLLTDSGGFQMVSLLKLAEITEEGVRFENPKDGKMMMLTPEKSIQIQNKIGADIMMALDDVVSPVDTSDRRIEEATHRTVRWIDRCIEAHSRPTEQNLFAIVQGGLDSKLRAICLKELIARDLPGYAIGGLAGGEDKDFFWRVVHQCVQELPKDKPRYLMGVGYPEDLIVCSALGVDMYDCVYPSRTARFGSALVPEGVMKLKSQKYKDDFLPIDTDCSCSTCKNYTRAALHQLAGKEVLGGQLLTIHNLHYLMTLMRAFRAAVKEDRLEAFVRDALRKLHSDLVYPGWVKDALKTRGIELVDGR